MIAPVSDSTACASGCRSRRWSSWWRSSASLQPVFLQPATLLELAGDTAVLFILATGVTFVIMLGGIDLSIQSMASLASVIVALTVAALGYWPFVLAVAHRRRSPASLSGLAHVRLHIPSFIATLAMGGVLSSTALVISEERSITLDEAERGYLAGSPARRFGIPHEIFIGAHRPGRRHLVQSRTRFGRYSAAIGAGEAAAYASGVKVDRQKVIALTCSPPAFAGFAGVILAGRLAWARRRSRTSCFCRRSRPWSSAAPRSPAASAASGARWSAR